MCFVEPNLLSHTAHSISKKGVKKRDLNDEELKDILADLLPLIRTDHIIPYNSDVLNSAIKRGLISRPPSHMIGDEGFVVQSSSWIRGKNNGLFVRPRLFGPYYEDAKVGNVDCTCNLLISKSVTILFICCGFIIMMTDKAPIFVEILVKCQSKKHKNNSYWKSYCPKIYVI